MAQENLQITITAVDRASGAFKGMANVVGSVQKNVESLNETARNLNWMFLGQDLLRAARTGATGLYQLAKASSDVAEAQNFVAQVFGDSSDTIEDFARTSTKATLMSERAILDASATFGVFGKSAGLAGDDLTGFSKNLVLLAADMASIKNTSVDQAINAIGAAFRNEHTPIRQYGAALDQASLKAEAFKLGIYDGTGALTTQQRIIATNQLLYEQLGFAVGDVGRTFDELANQSRYTQASFENFKAQLGGSLEPAFKSLLGLAQSAMEAFTSLPEPVQNLAVRATAAGTALLALGGGMLLVAAKVSQGIQAFRDLKTSMADWQAQAGTAGRVIGTVGKALGGLALVAVGTEIIGQTFNDITNYAGKTADAIDDISIALAKANTKDAVKGFQDLAKAENEAFKFSGLWEDFGKELQVGLDGPTVSIENLDDAFNKLLESGGPEAAGQMLNALNEQAQGLDKNSRAYQDAVEIINRYTPKVERATQATQAAGNESGLSAEQIEQFGDAALGAGESTHVMQAGIDEAAEALAEMRDAFNKVDSAILPLEDRIEGFSDAVEGVFANEVVDNAIDIADSVQEITDALKDEDAAARSGAAGLDVWNESGRDGLKAVEDLRDAIGKDLVRVFKETGGNVDEARKAMEFWRDTVADQMRQAGVAEPVIQSYLEKLGLTEGTFESVLKLSGQEEARRKLDELNISYQELPPAIYTQVQAQIDAGDYMAAYETMKTFLTQTIDTPTDTTGEEQAAQDARGTMEGVLEPPVTTPVNAKDMNAATVKNAIVNLFSPWVPQGVESHDVNAHSIKGRIASIFGWGIGQDINTHNDDAQQTKNSISNVFSKPITQSVTVSVVETIKRTAGSFFGVSGGQTGAAAPSMAEYAATAAPTSGVRAGNESMSLPAPVSAGVLAPAGTPSIVNLSVNMPIGTNENRVVDLLRDYQRTNGRGRFN